MCVLVSSIRKYKCESEEVGSSLRGPRKPYRKLYFDYVFTVACNLARHSGRVLSDRYFDAPRAKSYE